MLQVAALYEELEDPEQAIEWMLMLASIVPTDPNALAHLGDLFDREDDKSQAFQCVSPCCPPLLLLPPLLPLLPPLATAGCRCCPLPPLILLAAAGCR